MTGRMRKTPPVRLLASLTQINSFGDVELKLNFVRLMPAAAQQQRG
ncbi:MAG: hypothetical protein KGR48_02275 [Alphaproteobacteria bacterium]|nr:hypothetical protein [Alphaproteobacteria bacterium]MDE2011496.1 hypothetical protein [Alphaproteobacteria bacterium]MDE2071887.1 hypothetical protein [Alphaproteobacteria bacterium]MDE2350393.1 hypothetical protein [Alphaproteobacteria bacterium]